MNEQTNEIICECGHNVKKHGVKGCHQIVSGLTECSCRKAREVVLEDEITRLLSLVEGQAQTITQLRGKLHSRCLDVHYGLNHVGVFWECKNPICVESNALLDSTAPSKEQG